MYPPHDCRDVKQYHAAADSTLPSSTKRKFEEGASEQPTKKIKIEEDGAAAGKAGGGQLSTVEWR